MGIRYNKSIFLKQVSKLADSPRVRKMMDTQARKEFEVRKKKLLEEFIGHKVTQEILSGPASANYSGTLSGRGNLFSFIGFSESADPINLLYAALQRGITMNRRPQVVKQKRGALYNYTVHIPDNRDLVKIAPRPWERGRSWVTGIERGISGLSYYIYKKTGGSNSGYGVQTSSPYIPGLIFKRVPYLSEMLKKIKMGGK